MLCKGIIMGNLEVGHLSDSKGGSGAARGAAGRLARVPGVPRHAEHPAPWPAPQLAPAARSPPQNCVYCVQALAHSTRFT